MGDGTSNVGLGLLNTSAAFGHTDYHAMLRKWLAGMPAEWGFTEENRTEPIRGAALPETALVMTATLALAFGTMASCSKAVPPSMNRC